jgi:hypothetical protein
MQSKVHAGLSGLVQPCLNPPSHSQLVNLAEAIGEMERAARDSEFCEMSLLELFSEQNELIDATDRNSLQYRAVLALVERNALEELGGLAA